MKPAPDQAARDAAVAERDRSVVIDAGAGTGKTSTIVRRIVELVAPQNDGEALDIQRIAAITFTRKAAGELAQRIRRALATGLRARPSPKRANRLRAALSDIDTAYIGTIHSLADRMLRELADQSGLGPQYEILDDIDELTATTTSILLQAASQGTMSAALEGTVVEGDQALADEVSQTIRLAQRSGLWAHTKQGVWHTRAGLSSLFHEFCLKRDNPPPVPDLVDLDLEATSVGIADLRRDFDDLTPEAQESAFGRWLGRYIRDAGREVAFADPATVFRAASRPLDRLRSWGPQKGRHCAGDARAFYVVKRLTGGRPNRKHPVRGEVSYDRENLQRPLLTWLATRLARTLPAVVALYEKIKAERQAVDHIDLLLQLRNLLRDDPDARRRCQERLDHVFVDEFQDTDPLQAEIVMFLVEDGQHASNWNDVVPVRGKLTIVGDPKQSIYRFRRADVVMYDRVRRKLLEREEDVTALELSANFRSLPPIIDWLNERCESLLGSAPDSETRFDADSGQVYHRPLVAGRSGPREPAVEVLAIDPAVGRERANVENIRALAAEVTARWIRRLLDDPTTSVIDPHDGKPRRPRAADIAVLTPVTTTLEPVFKELDRFDIPYAMSGGRLFFNDPLHQTLLLALRSLAGGRDSDIDDGAALAALYSPPVFGLDPGTIARARSTVSEDGDDAFAAERAVFEQVADVVADLRRHRTRRSPGDTARLLLERSALGRSVALHANGRQRLRRLYELCQIVDEEAKRRGLDFDAVTRELRDALEEPPQVDAPPPLGDHAVSVLTIHQAKGLEFPVVILWDCTAYKEPPVRRSAWEVDRDGERWAMGLDGLVYDSREGDAGREDLHLAHELRRLFYVACTRARDRLVLTTTARPRKGMHEILIPSGADDEHQAQIVRDTHSLDGSAWGNAVRPPRRDVAADPDDPYPAASAAWNAAREKAAKPIARPVAVSAWAHGEDGDQAQAADHHMPAELRLQDAEAADATPTNPPARRRGRYGRSFGNTVHAALEAILRNGTPVDAAVDRSARAIGLADGLKQTAREDVERALQALRRAGILGRGDVVVRPEYPLAGAGDPGEMLVGFIDVVATDGKTLWILDYKTDQPPKGEIADELPQYVAQVRAYADLLARAGLASERDVKKGLLFTAKGDIRWV